MIANVAIAFVVVLVVTLLVCCMVGGRFGGAAKAAAGLVAALAGMLLVAGCRVQARASPDMDPQSQRDQLNTFHAWARSPTTAAVLIVAFVVLVVLVFTPLAHRVFRHPPGDTWKAVVVGLGALGVASWVTRSSVLLVLMAVALWGCVVWLLARHLGAAVIDAGRLRAELDPEKRVELQAEQHVAAERGAALEKVLDQAEGDRSR